MSFLHYFRSFFSGDCSCYLVPFCYNGEKYIEHGLFMIGFPQPHGLIWSSLLVDTSLRQKNPSISARVLQGLFHLFLNIL